ncbi:MAG: amino acid adenylation domain-containing protein [Proteobacteria bacterium]|nr:amino acid adenylation domain-containing protein [Pseudomonadota bacterium]
MSAEQEVFAFPASFAQQRLWFVDQVAPGTATYNIPQAFRMRGPVDLGVLERNLCDIVKRHEALRTVFNAEEGELMQVVDESRQLEVARIDLSDRPEAEREAEVLRLARQDATRPFDLSDDLLLRATLITLGEHDCVLILNVHHIVCDGWSLAIFFDELSQLYRAYAAGKSSPLPDVEIQYADYAIWQREWLQGEELDKQTAFWKEAMAGELPILELPGDHTRPPQHNFRGSQLRFHLDAETTDAIVALGRARGVSLFMTLMAAFKVFLHRISGQDDILLGSPIANRDRAEIEKAIGFYTNTIVFRSDLSGSPTFEELLGRVRDRALGVLANQDIPLEKVVEAVSPDRRSGDNPLFQVMFAVQKAPESAIDIAGVSVEALEVHSATSKFDILLEMQELSRGMQCLFEYNTDIFESSTAQRLIGHLQTLITALASDPGQSIDHVPLMNETEREQVVRGWNATDAEYDREARLHDAFVAHAAEKPDAIAVEIGTDSLTYGQLDRRSNQLANHLQGLGVKAGELVGIFVDRSLDMMVGLLGVLKSGAAYLPLDPAYPPDRIGYMLSDSKARILLTQSHLVDELPPHETTVIKLDSDWEEIQKASDQTPTCPSGPTDLAYQIYTSGSTGRPKGVQIPHRAVVNFLASMAREPGLESDDKLLAVTTLSFDISVLELFLPLSVGATVIVATRDEAVDGADLMERIERSGATVMQATPATWRMLIDSGWEKGSKLKVLCGGEALPPVLAGQLIERTAALWNMYGPTETTIWSSCWQVTDPERVMIGKPIANTQIYIVDRNLQPVPIGVAGDLYIAGDGLARGYHERPELTDERFVPNPFADGTRMYKTGDLARYQQDGAIEYLQRSDNQVKVRGFRIELGEIESVLAQEQAISQSVVTVWDDGTGDKRLVAYTVYKDGESLTSSELRKFLRKQLPDYMVPHLFVELDAMPLTDNGKVNRRALPDPLKQDLASEEEYQPPRTDMEKQVAEIWRELLKIERVGLRDNFYDLGGHSLLSTQMTYRLEKKTGYRLGPRSVVFQNLEQIAAECDKATTTEPAAASPASAPKPGPAPWDRPSDEQRKSESLSRKLFKAIKGRVFRP